jgi:hypothetical protein
LDVEIGIRQFVGIPFSRGASGFHVSYRKTLMSFGCITSFQACLDSEYLQKIEMMALSLEQKPGLLNALWKDSDFKFRHLYFVT